MICVPYAETYSMKSIFLAGLLMLILSSCKKDVTDLPAVSETGANIFGAKVNGALWVPQDNAVLSTLPILEGRLTPDGVFIEARNFASEPNEEEFELFIKNVTGPGVYPLNSETSIYPDESASYGYFIKRRITPINEWLTNSQYTGQVTITRYDVANHIVAGTFSFQAKEINGAADPLNVTDGRFDVKVQ
jgi:hypothetical protein